jgi:hypothetical protein
MVWAQVAETALRVRSSLPGSTVVITQAWLEICHNSEASWQDIDLSAVRL